MNVVKGFVVVILAQPSSLVVLVLVCEVGCDGRRAQSNGTLLHKTARVRVACLASGVGQLALREENGLLETFLSMCGSSTPAPSCQDERLQQTSCAEWRARGSCTTARLQSNPTA